MLSATRVRTAQNSAPLSIRRQAAARFRATGQRRCTTSINQTLWKYTRREHFIDNAKAKTGQTGATHLNEIKEGAPHYIHYSALPLRWQPVLLTLYRNTQVYAQLCTGWSGIVAVN